MRREKDCLFPLLVFFCAFLLMWYRAPERIERGFLWAEDATIFVAQARELGIGSFVRAYSGYWHFVPRLVAWLQMKSTPIEKAPYFFAWACALITAVSSAYMACAFRNFSRPVAALLALAPLLVPQTGEVLLNITNIQWILFPTLIVLLWENLFDPAESWYGVRSLAVAAIALTGPFGIITFGSAVLATIYACRRGPLSRRQIRFLVAYVAGVAGQVYAIATNASPPLDFGASPSVWNYGARMIRDLFCDLLPSPDGAPLVGGLILAVALVFVTARSRAVWACLLLAPMALIIWLLGSARTNPEGVHMAWYGFGARYVYPALLFSFWSALLSAATTTSKLSRILAGALVIVILLASATRFSASEWPMWEVTRESAGYMLKVAPSWTAQIPGAR
ncbi:hypothetical protein OKW35_001189 [Paraburkholderia sp. MM5477-R1]